MIVGKINLYLFSQIFKNFLLILFIFLTVSWLLQITRLFTISNFVQIDVINIIFLSFFLLPNIITVITPFILIFGLLLCFIKLNKDNELIAILSLGLGVNPFKKTLFFFSIIIITLFSLLNFYFSPIIYEKYKIQEYDLRNTLDFKNMGFSNFISLNESTILDFDKKNNEYQDIFISFNDQAENIIFAKKGNIFNENDQFKFQLSNGFKISLDSNKQIEKLEFQNYVLKIENKNNNNERILDKNTFTIFDDLKSKNYLNISFKIIDIVLILYVVFLFYVNNLKKINFEASNCIYFSILSIVILIINQMLKNSEIVLLNYFIIIFILLFCSSLLTYLKKKYE